MTRQAFTAIAALTILTSGCGGSPTATDGVPSPAPVFTARLVTPDTLELTIDNRASPTDFLMGTCNMGRERFDGSEWTSLNPLGDVLQCGGSPSFFPAGEITTFRKKYLALGSDGALERIRTDGLVAVVGTIVSWPSEAVPFFSDPFPGGVK